MWRERYLKRGCEKVSMIESKISEDATQKDETYVSLDLLLLYSMVYGGFFLQVKFSFTGKSHLELKITRSTHARTG